MDETLCPKILMESLFALFYDYRDSVLSVGHKGSAGVLNVSFGYS